MIDIYSQSGQLKCSIEPGSSSEQQKALQGDNVLSLSFTLYEAVMLDVNDYTDFCGERYRVTERYLPKQNSTVEWTYDVKLYGIESLIKRFLVLQNSDGENEAVFTLTAPAREHAAMIIEAINKGMGTTRWKVGSVIATENLTIDYEGTYCNEGLEKVAKEAGTEYWFEGTTLNICKAETGTQLELGYGRGLLSLERDVADNVKIYTRLFPIGSTRNIDPSKYGHTCLQLPDGRKYIDKDIDKYGVIHHYEKEAFKEIYPRRIGVVSSVRSINKKGDDGKEFTIYYFKDDALSFDPNKYELAGKVKHVVFQSGELDGRDFEVNYDSGKKEFEIITTWPYKDGTQLPGGMLVPARGDRYILWNLRMPDEYYPLAEKEFLHAVETFNREHYIDRSVYKAPTDHVWVEDNDAELLIGRRVKLYSDKYFPETGYRSSRITKITRKVALPSQADLDISDALSTGTMDKIEDSIGALKSYVRQTASALPDIIRTIDDTLPTDNNLFSARRILQDFLSKNRPGTLSELITFLKGIALGKDGGYSLDATGRAILRAILSDNYRSGESGFALYKNADGTTHLQVDYIEVLRKAVFAVLERRELSHAGGDTVFSGAGSKIIKVEETADGYKCFFMTDDGTTATRNEWQVDDQAMCRTDNIKAGVHEGVSNRYYWRRVMAIGDDYVVLSKTDRDYTTDGQGRITHDSDVPAGGDKIVQFGNRTDKSRQNITMIRVQGENAGIVQYVGVNGYSLEGKCVYISSPQLHEVAAKTFRLIDYNGEAYDIPLDKGQWQKERPYGYHNRVSHDGSYWLCTIAPGQSTTAEPKDGSAAWQKQVSRGGKGDKGDAAVELHLDVVRGDTFYREGQGFVAELEATVIQGGKDLTPTLHASQLVWTRESEDTAGDEEWNARHRSIGNRITVSTEDLTNNTAVVFTLYDEHGIASKLKGRMAFRQTPKDGVPGMTLQLIPDRLVLSTDDDGIVKDFSGASCLVQLVRGTTVLAPAVVKVQQVNCAAQVTNNTVKITGISVDPATNYSFGSGYVDLSATVDGQTLKGRLNVEVNIHRAVAKLEKSNKGIVAEVDTLDKKVNSHKESIAKLAVRQGEIDLSVKEYTPQRNLLRGTSFRFASEIPQNNREHPATLSPETYKGSGVVDINVNESDDVYSGIYYARIRGVAGKRLTLSFMTKTITKPDAMGAEVKAYKSDWEPSDIKFRLAEYYIPENNEWQLHSITFDVPGDTEHLDIPIYIAKSGHALIARPMLEESSEYRGWTPSPLDDIDAVKRCGVNVNAERIELDGKSVFKNGHAPEVPLFDEKGKVNPSLSAAQYLMEVLKSMETVIDGGLVMAGLIAAKDAGGNVTAYLNGLRQKMYALAAGVKNFGKDNETSLSHIGFDGSAQFGNLGIAYDGRVSIIDEAGKPRINVTPKELPSDGELLKTADTDITQPLPAMTIREPQWEDEFEGGVFTTTKDNSYVVLTGRLLIIAYPNENLPDRTIANFPVVALNLRNTTTHAQVNLDYWAFAGVMISNGMPEDISESTEFKCTCILPAGRWQLSAVARKSSNVHSQQIHFSSLQVNISHKSGAQALSLARNGWSVVQSEKQAAYVRDGKLCAVGAMNIPGILLAGTVNRLGQLSNAWGEFAEGTGLQYTTYGGVQVLRLKFRDPLPCGANYVAIVNPNDDTSPYGCMPVVRHKTENYCDFRVVNDSGGEVSNVGLDFMIIGRNK